MTLVPVALVVVDGVVVVAVVVALLLLEIPIQYASSGQRLSQLAKGFYQHSNSPSPCVRASQ